MAFSLSLRKEAARYGIDGEMLKRLHSKDLQCLIIQFKIEELNEYFRLKNNSKGEMYKEHISGNEALAMLGRK